MTAHALQFRPLRLPRRRSAARAFTLIELLIVVVVLAILASLALPTLAGAAAPLSRPIADLLESDLRLARLEAMGSTRTTVLVVGAAGDRWWVQPAGELGPDRAMPATLRVIGFDTLKAYEGHRLDITVNGQDLPPGDTAIAEFNAAGTRNDSTIRVALVSPIDSAVLARWKIEPRRTRLREDQ